MLKGKMKNSHLGIFALNRSRHDLENKVIGQQINIAVTCHMYNLFGRLESKLCKNQTSFVRNCSVQQMKAAWGWYPSRSRCRPKLIFSRLRREQVNISQMHLWAVSQQTRSDAPNAFVRTHVRMHPSHDLIKTHSYIKAIHT